MNDYLTEVRAVQQEVRDELRLGAKCNASSLEDATELLNRALALNTVCVLRHMRHFVTAERFGARDLAQEFLEHTVQESEHSDRIVASIHRLGGGPVFDRESVNHRERFECASLVEFEQIIRDDLAVENEAIAAYSEIIDSLSDIDSISTQLLRQIHSLAVEHAEVMLNYTVVAVD